MSFEKNLQIVERREMGELFKKVIKLMQEIVASLGFLAIDPEPGFSKNIKVSKSTSKSKSPSRKTSRSRPRKRSSLNCPPCPMPSKLKNPLERQHTETNVKPPVSHRLLNLEKQQEQEMFK
ncbi:CLUMA_CG009653, isoform A [Clunio marinus]|uniref:CLUMA_CG009653, isoform A n=1 Tax=Clunio marinus TaxID=568069 RepID=A0A1J1I923_9DIPT|nr:CLUMA_CG009653, isoform A [Clunio marinus]